MTDFRASGEAVPIDSIDQLVEEVQLAAKPRDRWLIGTEYEKVAVDPRTRRAAPFSGSRGIETLLRELAERFGWTPTEENGRTIALTRDRASITLEPGGQVELSGEPCQTLHCTRDELATHVRELSEIGGELGIALLGVGMQPGGPPPEIGWGAQQRHPLLRGYNPPGAGPGAPPLEQTGPARAN